MGILRDKTFGVGEKPAAGRATEEVWTKWCPAVVIYHLSADPGAVADSVERGPCVRKIGS